MYAGDRRRLEELEERREDLRKYALLIPQAFQPPSSYGILFFKIFFLPRISDLCGCGCADDNTRTACGCSNTYRVCLLGCASRAMV